jgi:Cu-processing system permease protein
MSNVLTITWLTFHEARRHKMVLAAILLGLLFIALYIAGFLFIVSQATDISGARGAAAQNLGLSVLTIAGLYVVHFLTIMLAIFASVATISGEISSHTIQAIATKPVRRWEIVLGKWIGYAIMLVPYSAFLSGGIIFSVYAITDFLPPNYPQAIGLIALQALVLLSLSLLGGTRFSTLTNGVVLFMLYGLAFIGSWIEQIGSFFQSRAAVNVGIVTSLLMPVEALWRLAAGMMQPPLLGLDRLSLLFGAASLPSGWMVVYSFAFVLVVLALAMRQFSRRDL